MLWLPPKANAGFTLLELIIAVAIFLVLIIIAGNVIFSAVRFQRVASNAQELQNNLRGALEIMGREVRLAAKDEAGTCVGTVRGNFAWSPAALVFLNDRGSCLQYALAGEQVQQTVNYNSVGGSPRTETLTAASVEVLSLQFDVFGESGNDQQQPRVLIRLSARTRGTTDNPIKLQTTLTQRELDVQ